MEVKRGGVQLCGGAGLAGASAGQSRCTGARPPRGRAFAASPQPLSRLDAQQTLPCPLRLVLGPGPEPLRLRSLGRLSLQRGTCGLSMVSRPRSHHAPSQLLGAQMRRVLFGSSPDPSEDLASALCVPCLCRLRMTVVTAVTLASWERGTWAGSLGGAQRCGAPAGTAGA